MICYAPIQAFSSIHGQEPFTRPPGRPPGRTVGLGRCLEAVTRVILVLVVVRGITIGVVPTFFGFTFVAREWSKMIDITDRDVSFGQI